MSREIRYTHDGVHLTQYYFPKNTLHTGNFELKIVITTKTKVEDTVIFL